MRVLNSSLYNTLMAAYGEVKIANQGCKTSFQHSYDALSGKVKSKIVSSGEYYRVCCHKCGDSRFRLYVSYLFGQYDDVVGDKILFPAICHNENCNLWRDDMDGLSLVNYLKGYLRGSVDSLSDAVIGAPEIIEWRIDDMGITQPLSKLYKNHPARIYLIERNLDPDYLSAYYDVRLSFSPPQRFNLMRGRIVFPLWMDKKLYGFQGRSYMPTEKLRWYTATGTKTSHVLYSFDFARQFDTIVLCEGITDTLTVGPQGTGTLGQTIHANHIQLIKNISTDKIVLVAYDQQSKSDEAVSKLKAVGINAVPIYMPDGIDDVNKWGWEGFWNTATRIEGVKCYR